VAGLLNKLPQNTAVGSIVVNYEYVRHVKLRYR
jgi:hypothetical protein